MSESSVKTRKKAAKKASTKIIGSSDNPHIPDKSKKDRELYAQWRAMPAMLRSLNEKDLKRMGYPVDDPVFQKMLSVNTKQQFCVEFGVGLNAPTRWERDPEVVARINEISQAENVMRFKNDVDFSFTQKVMRHGDAHRMKLWKQLYEGWSERTENINMNLNMTPADLVESIEARNAKLRDNKSTA